MPTYEYDCKNCGTIEIFHGMTEDDKTVCPECGLDGLSKMISGGAAIIIAGRQANQYNDIKKAKYWRDHNGVRHRVTPADGSSKSGTPSRKQTKTPEEVAQIKKNAAAQQKKAREAASYKRYVDTVKRRKRQ